MSLEENEYFLGMESPVLLRNDTDKLLSSESESEGDN